MTSCDGEGLCVNNSTNTYSNLLELVFNLHTYVIVCIRRSCLCMISFVPYYGFGITHMIIVLQLAVYGDTEDSEFCVGLEEIVVYRSSKEYRSLSGQC